MKKATVKITLLALLIMGVMLAGCGKKTDDKNTIDKNTIYHEEEITVKLPNDATPDRVFVGEGVIYATSSAYDEKAEVYKSYMYSMNPDGTDLKSISLFEGNGWVSDGYITKNGNLLLSKYTYFEDYSDPDNYEYEEHRELVEIDKNLNIVKSKDMKSLEIDYLGNLSFLKDGKLLIYADSKLILLDENYNKVKEKEIPDNIYLNSFFETKDGVCLSYWGEENIEYKKLDLNTMEMGEDFSVPFNLSQFTYIGSSDKYDLLVMDTTAVYGFNIGDAGLTCIFNLVDSDINTSSFDSFIAMADDSFIGSYGDWSTDSYIYKVCKYTKVDPKDVVEKEIISLGTTYTSYDIRSAVVKFNKSNDKYRVRIIDYDKYNTEDDYSAGQKKMNSDIATGQSPDIILTSDDAAFKSYASKGLFVDLHKFLDDDASIDKNDIFPNLIQAYETDGKLYQIAPSFYISTMVIRKDFVGNLTSWNAAQMMEVGKNLPEGTSLFGKSYSRENLLYSALYVNTDEYIDYAKATCSFDSEEFKNILQICKDLPKSDDIDWDKIYADGDYESQWRSNKTAIYELSLSGPEDYLYSIKACFGENPVFIGFPTDQGSGHVMYGRNPYAISSKSKNQEGAWEFVKYFFGEEYQSTITYGMPASMKRFDELCKEAMEKPSYTNELTGETEYYDSTYWIGGQDINIDPLTQAEADTIKNLVLATTKLSGSVSEDIINIIDEEASLYFEGQKTIDETCKLIQSRISIYLKEKQ